MQRHPAHTNTPDTTAASSTTAHAATGGHTYDQIVKSSILIGGSSAFNVLIGVVRTKAMALLLGTAGFGLMGLYASILNLVQSVAGLGVNSSGVRQIAAAAGSGDSARIALTIAVLRRTSIVLGLLGALLLVALCGPISQVTFGNYGRAAPVALLSIAALFKTVGDGQAALIQGLRRISDLATIALLGGILGAAASVTLVYFLRERGVVPSLIAISGMSLLVSWHLSRRVALACPALSASQVRQEAAALLKLGFAFMASGMLMLGAAYAIRLIIVRRVGLQAAGLYQSAWAIGGMYVGFILQAMAADFYPRLTAVVKDHEECNRIVNEQAEVSMLLAGPGILATLTLAPFVISLLYSSAFGPAVELLRWMCLGATFQVVSWPMGFIIVAGGRQAVFFWSELAYAAFHVGAAWGFIRVLGVNGAGVAFFASYAFHGLMVYPIVRWLTGFRWSGRNRRIGAAFLGVIAFVFCGFEVLPPWLATVVGLLATLLIGLRTGRALGRLVSANRLPGPIMRIVTWVRTP